MLEFCIINHRHEFIVHRRWLIVRFTLETTQLGFEMIPSGPLEIRPHDRCIPEHGLTNYHFPPLTDVVRFTDGWKFADFAYHIFFIRKNHVPARTLRSSEPCVCVHMLEKRHLFHYFYEVRRERIFRLHTAVDAQINKWQVKVTTNCQVLTIGGCRGM